MAGNHRTNPRKKKKVATELGEDDDGLTASQESTGSDDMLMQAAINKMQVSWEKKRKEKEHRFLVAAKKDMNRHLLAETEAFQEGIKNCDAAS